MLTSGEVRYNTILVNIDIFFFGCNDTFIMGIRQMYCVNIVDARHLRLRLYFVS